MPSRVKKAQDPDASFLGVRIPSDLHRRLYRVKATMEYSSGKFYGLSKVVEQALDRGLSAMESEMPESSAKPQS